MKNLSTIELAVTIAHIAALTIAMNEGIDLFARLATLAAFTTAYGYVFGARKLDEAQRWARQRPIAHQ